MDGIANPKGIKQIIKLKCAKLKNIMPYTAGKLSLRGLLWDKASEISPKAQKTSPINRKVKEEEREEVSMKPNPLMKTKPRLVRPLNKIFILALG